MTDQRRTPDGRFAKTAGWLRDAVATTSVRMDGRRFVPQQPEGEGTETATGGRGFDAGAGGQGGAPQSGSREFSQRIRDYIGANRI